VKPSTGMLVRQEINIVFKVGWRDRISSNKGLIISRARLIYIFHTNTGTGTRGPGPEARNTDIKAELAR
jgi:hypothetical protein